uniref:TonB C-terminal domain-containing protein n=1 Tax=uncultured bacterium fosmid pJB42G5 TaxID=1478064 RepID=A0A0H3U7R5_9BACT|nr:hypothetical protein [uncultured bacterium fosmid pJB42G5]
MDYREIRKKRERNAKVTGIVVTVAVHVLIVVFGAFSGFKYIYPPPEEKSILIEFEEIVEQDPIRVKTGTEPRMENPDPTQHINLVKASEAQVEGRKANLAQEATVGPDGDVEVPEPPREKEINKRALFHAADNTSDKDTLAPQTAYKPSDNLSAGHASGNAKNGKTTGEPNAHLKGRQVLGQIPSPSYGVQRDGVVVVSIWVNNYGEVTKAIAGADGTTVTDNELWAAARSAALKTHFNMAPDAPVLQEGTITYNFKLK